MITQTPREALNPTMRLGTLFTRTLKLHGVPRTEIGARAAQSLGEVSLDVGLLHRYPSQVSGGQAQRFTIALALALRADLVLADEPTSALDVTVQAEIAEMLRRLRDEHGRSMLFISHDLALVSELVDDVLVMRDGGVVEQGPAARVFGQPESDYTKELLSAVPTIKEQIA